MDVNLQRTSIGVIEMRLQCMPGARGALTVDPPALKALHVLRCPRKSFLSLASRLRARDGGVRFAARVGARAGAPAIAARRALACIAVAISGVHGIELDALG